MAKKRIFSGIQPSGVMTLGNYVGAITNWDRMQDEFDCFYSVVDLHALTVRQDPDDLRRRTREMYALLVACGIDTRRSVLFVQSHVAAHAQLTWLLNTMTYMGELSRMTQFKDKSARHSDNINAGLFDYPVLMASDILLYDADMVPVGEDQRQHLELTRDIAIRFNNAYGDTFIVPEPYIPKVGGKVMSLSEPEKKMSKSDENANAFISILDEPDVILKKFKRAVTDSDTEKPVRYDPEQKPGVTNLMNIYTAMTGQSAEQIEQAFDGQGYGAFKPAVAQAVIDKFEPIQTRFKQLMADKATLDDMIHEGAKRAHDVAAQTLERVSTKMGLL